MHERNLYRIAGLSGVLLAIATLRTNASVDIKHLRGTNPLVSSTLHDWFRNYRMRAHLPRQTTGT